ncbi:MAG: LysM peptidoglycan-binding domain-containing protein [Pirellulales bacterium]
MAVRRTVPRETKIGVTVVFALLVIFVYVVVNRVRETSVSETDVSVVEDQSSPVETPAETVHVASAANQQAPEYDDNRLPPSEDTGSYYRQAQRSPPELPADRYAFLPPETIQSDDVAPSVEQQPAPAEEIAPQISQDDVSSEYASAEPTDVPPAQFQLEPVQQPVADVSQEPLDVRQEVRQESVPLADQQPPTFTAPDSDPPAVVGDRYTETNFREQEATNTPPGYSGPQQEQAYVQSQQYANTNAPTFQQVDQSQVAQVSQVGPPDGDYAQRAHNGQYDVQPNDNFWTISETLYGTGSYFKALMEYNRQRYPLPERLAVGDKVLAPPRTELIKLYPDLCPKDRKRPNVIGVGSKPASDGQVYVVQEGDTLFDIARYELGDPSRWVEIYKLNAHQLTGDFDYVRPGSRLVLPRRGGRPVGSHDERMTQQPQGEPSRQ